MNENKTMDVSSPSFIDLLIETHLGLERQGPGSPETIKKALAFLEPLDRFQEIADLGCGSGGQTLLLAELLPGRIVGLDLFPAFVDALNEKARSANLADRVTGVTGDMAALPFQRGQFDLIWSEGAIDNIGFRKGLGHWREFLKDGGYVAVTCPTWLTNERPAEVEQFWTDAGSRLETLEDGVDAMQERGYKFVAAFALSEDCWTERYFYPREAAINKLLEKYKQCDTVKEYAEINRREVELYLKFKRHYGYVFYIGQAVERDL